MKLRALSALLGLTLVPVAACDRRAEPVAQEDSAGAAPPAPEASEPAPPIRLFDDLGDHHHPITAASPEVQRWFDQGLTLTYGFNHEAAVRSFEAALELDPACAMCWWGIGFALGPNINAPMGPEAAGRAHQAVEHAQALAANVTEVEQAYIAALAARYVPQPAPERAALDQAFAAAMGELQARYPEDADAATLRAEALMDLSPWNYWIDAETPRPHMVDAIRLLEEVQQRDPSHPGANHYYIHVMETYHPEKAVPAAERLAALAPESGHLVHMPSHIFWRVGRYEEALEINRRAALRDEAYLAWCQAAGRDFYRAAYYPHNLHFLWSAAMAEGRGDLALSTARRLEAALPDLSAFPFAEEWRAIPMFTLLRFGRWDPVLAVPAPDPALRYETAIWHYGRGLALLRLGRLEEAQAEREQLAGVAAEEGFAELDFTGEPASSYGGLALAHLDGELAASRGDGEAAVAALADAVRRADAMNYTEPPRWYFPLRQALGAVLLDLGEATRAEAVYRADLERVPRNGWSLFGLAQSLRAQGREAEAAAVEEGFGQAWQRADVVLTASRY